MEFTRRLGVKRRFPGCAGYRRLSQALNAWRALQESFRGGSYFPLELTSQDRSLCLQDTWARRFPIAHSICGCSARAELSQKFGWRVAPHRTVVGNIQSRLDAKGIVNERALSAESKGRIDSGQDH
jgi:hypothetical protein